MALEINNVAMIEVSDWDRLVNKTYGRTYSFQQQDDCKPRGIFRFKVPDSVDSEYPDTIEEKVNGDEMGVSFAAWLARDPKKPIPQKDRWALDMWWERNFYPDVQEVANDLHARGLLPAGKYVINIDW